MKLLIATPGS